jgi:hypothetical protein
MGQSHDTIERPGSARENRFGWRTCLRKGCGRTFQAVQHNHQYCGTVDCRRELQRWQSLKRQRKCRSKPEGQERHRQSECERRQRKKAESAAQPGRDLAVGEGVEPGAWSRGEKIPEDFCDRPGCYEATRESARAAACYCGDDCRRAVHQARDRERKCLRRKTKAGRYKRRLEYEAARADRQESAWQRPIPAAKDPDSPRDSGVDSVSHYRRHGVPIVGFKTVFRSPSDDRQADSGCRPRAPPSP